MADARFLSAEAEIKDPQRAILSAASACEIKAKITMRDRVDDEQAEALEKRLKHTSNLRDLIERPAKIAFGKKLNGSCSAGAGVICGSGVAWFGVSA